MGLCQHQALAQPWHAQVGKDLPWHAPQTNFMRACNSRLLGQREERLGGSQDGNIYEVMHWDLITRF